MTNGGAVYVPGLEETNIKALANALMQELIIDPRVADLLDLKTREFLEHDFQNDPDIEELYYLKRQLVLTKLITYMAVELDRCW